MPKRKTTKSHRTKRAHRPKRKSPIRALHRAKKQPKATAPKRSHRRAGRKTTLGKTKILVERRGNLLGDHSFVYDAYLETAGKKVHLGQVLAKSLESAKKKARQYLRKSL